MGDGYEPSGDPDFAEVLAELDRESRANTLLRDENRRLRQFIADLNNHHRHVLEHAIESALDQWTREMGARCRTALSSDADHPTR